MGVPLFVGMNAKIVSIGDELLIGQTVNTNASWMGKRLTEDGWRVVGVEAIADDEQAIVDALNRAETEADVVLLTGGLGPTKDDITKTTLAKHFGTELVMHEDIAENIEAWFRSRNVPFLEVNRLQAMLPASCTALPNPLGTASGMWFERANGSVVVSLPGVPYEMEGLMDKEVLPRLRNHFELPTTLYETVMTAGIGESSLAAMVSDWEEGLAAKGVGLAYLPSPGQVKMRLGVKGSKEDGEALQGLLEAEVVSLIGQIGSHFVGRGDHGLAPATLKALSSAGETLAVAESCTGGSVAAMVTAVPGASASFLGGVVAYSNEVKRDALGVDAAVLEANGAVSEAVVKAMAKGVKHAMGATWGLATSGVAGPGGGSEAKPVGMVWMAISGPHGEEAWCHHLGRERQRIVERATRRILTHLFQAIQQERLIHDQSCFFAVLNFDP